ncbi:protein fluG [Xylaria intraflava]|nr:protein fluG [Xylaria intraflava]
MAAEIDDDRVKQFFQKKNNYGVKFVRLQWLDYSGVLRARVVTKSRCMAMARKASTDRCALAQNCMVIPISTAPRCWPDGIEEWHLLPDWDSLMVCGSFAPTHAAVMCYTAHTGLADQLARCPRSALQKSLDAFAELCPGSELLMGFEIEMVLLDGETLCPTRPLDHTVGFSMMAGMRGQNLDIMEEIVTSLSISGIDIHHFHVELRDQYEIALSALPPMKAIDSLVMAMETIRTVCLRHGLKASMAPKPVLHGPLSGCHVHLSISQLSDALASSFLAGVLSKLKTLCVLGLPNYDSYSRVVGDCAGEWVGWGTGNKDLPIRGVNPSRWEFRFLDATANMYLFTAGLLSAGMAGIRTCQTLNITDCQVVPSALSPDEAARQLRPLGIVERMPTSLEATVKLARSDEDLKDWLGVELHTQYLNVKDKEAEYFGEMTEEQRRQKFLDYF